MVGEHRITDPSQLSDLSLKLSQLRVSDNVPSGSQQRVVLALLQPLSKDEVFDACRNPGSKILRKPDGTECGTIDDEYLNLEPVSTAWRQALRDIPPMSNIIFDLTLPMAKGDKAGELQPVSWDTAPRPTGGVYVVFRDVRTIAITLSTATRMRTAGKVSFVRCSAGSISEGHGTAEEAP